MAPAIRTCPTCGDVRTLTMRSRQPVVRECRVCASRRVAERYPFTKEEAMRGRQTYLARLAELDPVVVDRLVSGRPQPATVPERVAAVRRLHERGLTASQIAGRLGVTTRSVERYRARIRQMAA